MANTFKNQGAALTTGGGVVYTAPGATTSIIHSCYVSNNATSSATAGTLYGVVDFASARDVISGDTLEVTVTLTAASA